MGSDFLCANNASEMIVFVENHFTQGRISILT